MMKHKRRILIVIFAVVLLAAGLVALAFLSPKSIEGEWELTDNPEVSGATPDEADKADRERVYYIFSKPDSYGDGTYKTVYDGGTEPGEYTLSQRDGQTTINLGAEELAYTITGSRLFGGRKLTITYPAHTDEETGQTTPEQEYGFTQAKAPDYEKAHYDAFETDPALLSEWITNERGLTYYVYEIPYTETVAFKDNGIMTIHYESEELMLDRTMYYAYTAKDGALTFSLVTDHKTQYTASYELNADGNLVFVKDETDASIFADAFFGSATYYTPDQLPAASPDETSN